MPSRMPSLLRCLAREGVPHEDKWFFVQRDLVFLRDHTPQNVIFTVYGLQVSGTGELVNLFTPQGVLQRPGDFQPPLWKVCVGRNTRVDEITLDVLIDLEVLKTYIENGVRFPGRSYLMESICALQFRFGIHENQVAYQKDRYYRLQTMATTPTVVASAPHLAEEDSRRLKCSLYMFQSRAVRRMLDLEAKPDVVRFLPRNVVRLGTSLASAYVKMPEGTLLATAETVTTHLRGGFYHDRMGSGKTVSMLALCECNKPPVVGRAENMPPATLIICPSHVVSHWYNEIKKYTTSSSVKVAVKADLQKLTHAELMSGKYQYVILSFNIFENNRYKEPLDYYSTYSGPSSIRKNITVTHARVKNYYVDHRRMPEDQKANLPFYPPAYDWWRIVVDEYHELHDAKYGVARIHVTALSGANVWLVSGTPEALRDGPGSNNATDHTLVSLMFRKPSDLSVYDFATAMYEKRLVLSENYDFELPGVTEEVVWLDLSTEERQLYEAVRTDGVEQQLRVCSYPRITAVVQRSAKHVDTIEEMVELAIAHVNTCISAMKANITTTEGVIESLPPGAHEQRTREGQLARERMAVLATQKAKLEELEMSARYMQSSREGHDDCVICMERMQRIAMLRSCGHRFCFDCCHRLVTSAQACAVCRRPACMKDVITTRNTKVINDEERAYGTKMAALIRYICESKDVKTLVFSQWDELLHDVGQKLQTYAKVLYCRGSILQKQSSIDKFCNTDDHNLLLLSTLHSGSGCDLSKATRVILLDTIMKPLHQTRAIERQAIARCHRMGQTRDVRVVRFLMRNTIEQEQYERIVRERNVSVHGAGASQSAPRVLEDDVLRDIHAQWSGLPDDDHLIRRSVVHERYERNMRERNAVELESAPDDMEVDVPRTADAPPSERGATAPSSGETSSTDASSTRLAPIRRARRVVRQRRSSTPPQAA